MNDKIKIEYPIQDEIWPSRRWNSYRTDYCDLSGENDVSCKDDIDIKSSSEPSSVAIRANIPIEFDITKHRVTKFKRDNYEGFYTIDGDDTYTFKGVSAESSIHYTERALLSMSNITVVK